MLRFWLAFAAGCLFEIHLPGFIDAELRRIAGLSFVLFFFLVYLLARRHAMTGVLIALAAIPFIFLTGCEAVYQKTGLHDSDHVLYHFSATAIFVELESDAVQTKRGSKSKAVVLSARVDNTWVRSSGKVLVYWPDSAARRYGDRFILNSRLQKIKNFSQSGFNYSKYLALQQIYFQVFVQPEQSIEAGHHESFFSLASETRRRAAQVFAQHIHSSRERAVLIALVLGDTREIDQDLRQTYAANGALHVLAVSGLHVAIIYGVLAFFFKPLQKFPSGKWLSAVLSLVILWAYAFITGLSPSVLRSVVMFSMVLLAGPMRRQTNIYNTIASSAFLLMVIDPFAIMSVGFQLSYLAVLGIVMLQRPLYLMIQTRNAVSDWLWKATTVTLAAQYTTTILSMYYFGQFPVFFALSNLFVIPLSGLVLIGGLVLLGLSPFPCIAVYGSRVLAWMTWIMNEALAWVETWPGSVIHVELSFAQCVLLYGLLSLWLLLFFQKSFFYLVAAAIVAFMYAVTSL